MEWKSGLLWDSNPWLSALYADALVTELKSPATNLGCSSTFFPSDRQTDRQDRQTDRQTGRQADRQTDGQVDKWMNQYTCRQQTTDHYRDTQLPDAVQDQWVDHNLPYVWVGASLRSRISTERKTLLLSRKPIVLHKYVYMMYKNWWSHFKILIITATCKSCQYCRIARGSSALVIPLPNWQYMQYIIPKLHTTITTALHHTLHTAGWCGKWSTPHFDLHVLKQYQLLLFSNQTHWPTHVF